MRAVKRVLLAAAMAAMPLSAVTATSAHAVAVQDESAERDEAGSWAIRAIVLAVIIGGFFYIFFIDEDDKTSP